MFKQIKLVFLAALVLGCLLNTAPAKAQGELPPWKNLNCNYPQKYRGLEYCTGMDGKAYVIVLDLTDQDIRLKYLIASGQDKDGTFGPCKDVNLPQWSTGLGCYEPTNTNFYPVFSLFDAIKEFPDAAAIIDSDYGARTNPPIREHGPEGFTVIEGIRIDGKMNGDTDNNAENRPWLAFGFDPIRVELDQMKPNSDDGLKPDWVYTAFGGAPWLVKDGILADDDIKSCKNADPHSCDKSSAQTAVGVSQDKRWLYFVMIVDVKNMNIDAMTIAKFMKDQLVVGQAIKLDGGGSSQLYYGGFPESNRVVFRGDGRWLSQYLGILAQPGTGINIESSPPSEPPSDDTDLNWWQKIKKGWNDFWGGIGNWWQEQQNKFTNWLDGVEDWWWNLPSRIEEWLLQQFLGWLNQRVNQLCGTTGLIPIAIAVVLYSKRRSWIR